MKADFKAHRGCLAKGTYFSSLVAHEKDLTKMKEEDWQPASLGLAFETQNFKSKLVLPCSQQRK